MKKLAIKCIWLSPKRNFLKKVAFWAQAKYTSKTRFIYGPLRSINENALLGVFRLLSLVCAFTKMSLTQTHKLIISLTPSSLICVFFLRLLPLRLPLLLHRSTPTINKTHFNLWYSEHRINKTKPKITQNQHKNNLKSTKIRKTHPKPNSKSTQNP